MDCKYNYLDAFDNRKIVVDEEGKPIDLSKLGQIYEGITATDGEVRQQGEEFQDTTKQLRESERRLRRAQELAQVGNWEVDLETKSVYASEEAYKLCGLKVGNKSSEEIMDLIHIGDRSRMNKALELLLKGEAEYKVDFRLVKADNTGERHMHSVAEVEYDNSGKAIRILGVIQDVTERVKYELDLKDKNRELRILYEELRQSEEELRVHAEVIKSNQELISLSEERYKTLVNNSQDIIYCCDCNGVITTINEKFCEVIGLPKDKIIGKTMCDIQMDDDTKREEWNNIFSGVVMSGEVISITTRYDTKDGSAGYYDVTLSPILDARRKVVGVIGTNHDITTIKENEQTIKHMAYYDFLTDLPNRMLFLIRLKNAIAISKQSGIKAIVIFLDLDNFRIVNDTLGHAIGDQLLIDTSKKVLQCIDKKGVAARLSGDEFSLLIEDIEHKDDIVPLLKGLKSIFEEPFTIKGNNINVTASIGVAVFPDDGDAAEELINNAHTAMIKAKESGKNDFQFFNVKFKNDLLHRINMERLLKRAIINDEFILHYQPQYITETGELRGFEALIRWNSPEMGFLNPMDFIPIAEETGLIVQIGEWVLNKACNMCKKIEVDYGRDNLIMAVNISPIQLRRKEFNKTVINAIEISGIKPISLELEVTESIFIDGDGIIAEELRTLKELGVKIALDDFGTGYSSLSYLRKLPINLLKIDKAFVQEIDSLNPHNELTESIIELVHRLKIKTVAEGIETLQQLNYLIDAKCDYLQGYLLGKPSAEDLIGGIVLKGCLKEFLL